MLKQRKELRFDIKNADKKQSFQYLALIGELGFSVSLPIVLGAIFGRIFDTKFNSSPKITLFLIFLGLFFSFAYIYKIVKNIK